MPTIAIVDDEDDLREAVAEFMSERGLDVIEAAGAAAFRERLAGRSVDIAVLDVAMPGEDGFALARWLRERSERVGIIFATAASAPRDRIAGIEIGADDYVVKPYNLRELLARIQSVLRRIPEAAERAPLGDAEAGVPADPNVVLIEPFVLNRVTGRLGGPDGALLTAAEIELLTVFASRPNRLLTREQLIAFATARGDDSGSRSVDVRIARLRRKLEALPGAPELIRTVRGEGYMFTPPG